MLPGSFRHGHASRVSATRVAAASTCSKLSSTRRKGPELGSFSSMSSGMVRPPGGLNFQCVCQGSRHQGGLGDGSKIHELDAGRESVRNCAGHGNSEPCLTCPPGPVSVSSRTSARTASRRPRESDLLVRSKGCEELEGRCGSCRCLGDARPMVKELEGSAVVSRSLLLRRGRLIARLNR